MGARAESIGMAAAEVPGRGREGRQLERRLTGLLVAVLVAAVLGVAAAPAANAAPGDSSNATARYLGGSLILGGVALDDVVSLGGSQAINNGSAAPVTDTDSLDVSALNALGVTIPGGISLGLLGSFLQLGAVNQFAQALDAGVSRSASGAVNDSGVVDTTGSGDFPAIAAISLTSLLSLPGFGTVLDQFDLSLQAVTGVAALDAGVAGAPATTCTTLSAPVHCRDYTINGGDLTLRSPLVATLADLLTGTGGVADTVDAAVATLTGPSGLLAQALATLNAALSPIVGDPGLTVAISSDVAGALDTILDTPLTDGVVTVNLRTGAISVDLGALVADVLGSDLDDLAPNTEILSGPVLAGLSARVGVLLGTIPAAVETAVTAALNAATLTVSGNVCVVGSPPSCTTPIVDIGTGVNVAVNGTLAQVVAGTATASITLKVAGLPVVVPVATLLAALAAPISDVLFDADGAVATTTATVTGIVAGVIDGLAPVLSALNGIASLIANVQEAGSVAASYQVVALRLTIGDLLGSGGIATLDLGQAEVGANDLGPPIPTAVSLAPDHGPLVGGDIVTVTGSGFVSGVTTVIFDGGPVTPSSVAGDGLSLTFAVPPGTVAGPVSVVISNGVGLESAPLTYTYDAPTVAASSPVLAGAETAVTGSGWPADAEVMLQLRTSGSAPVGSPVVVTSTAGGALPAGTTVEVPVSTATQGLVLDATDEFGNTASDDLDVIGAPAAVSLSPDHGPLVGGTVVTVTGSSFVAGVTTVIFDGGPVTPSSVAGDGLSLTFAVPPGTVAGPVSVVISNGVGLESAPLTYTYDAPTLAATSPVLAGAASTATGTLWPASVQVTLQLRTSGSAPVGSPAVVTSTAGGGLPAGTTVTVPLATATQTLSLIATDAFGNTAAANVAVIGAPAAVSLTPNHGPLVGGTVVTVTGSSFVAGVTTMIFDGGSVAPSSVAGDGLSLTFAVPPGTVAGPVNVVIRNGASLDSGPLSYTYDGPTIDATSPVEAGTATAVTGAGWPAATTVALQLLSAGTAVGGPVSITTTAAGTFPAGTAVLVPESATAGAYSVRAVDAFQNTAVDEVAVEVAAVAAAGGGDGDGGGAAAAAGGGQLPRTGAGGITMLAAIGLLLVVVGLALFGIGTSLRTASRLIERACDARRRPTLRLVPLAVDDDDRAGRRPRGGVGPDGAVGISRLR